jgi:hypothetical protein
MSDLFLGLVNDRALLVVFVRLALKCMAGHVAAVPPRSPKGPEPQCEKVNNGEIGMFRKLRCRLEALEG